MLQNPLTILLVEDNPGDARLIREMLAECQSSDASPSLVHAENLKRGLQMGSMQPFDVALLDLNLPDSTGLETLKKFNAALPQIPIIVLTGLNDEVVSYLSLQHGALNYVVKDECTSSLLVRAIRYAIERKRVEEHFKHLATHDILTGLPNRSLFYDRLSQAVRHTERNRVAKVEKWKIAIMLIDLYGLKEINDHLGHTPGDAVLRLAAQCLRAVLRGSDTIARLGGDEFITIIEGVSSQQDCLVVAEKMLRSLSNPVLLEEQDAHLQASIGVSIFPDDTTELEDLIQYAEAAMNTAKRQNNQICFYKDLPRA